MAKGLKRGGVSVAGGVFGSRRAMEDAERLTGYKIMGTGPRL